MRSQPCRRLLEGSVDPWKEGGSLAGAGLLAGLMTPWQTHAGAVCSQRSAPCGRDTRWRGAWEGLTLEFVQDCLLWEGPHTGEEDQGKSVRSPALKRTKQQRQCVMNLASLPIPLCCWRGEAEKVRMKLSPRRMEEWGKVFYDLVLFAIILLWFGNKFISPS